MKNTLPILISILLSISFAKAYGPKDKDIELSNLIGKRIFQAPLIEWLEKNSYKTALKNTWDLRVKNIIKKSNLILKNK